MLSSSNSIPLIHPAIHTHTELRKGKQKYYHVFINQSSCVPCVCHGCRMWWAVFFQNNFKLQKGIASKWLKTSSSTSSSSWSWVYIGAAFSRCFFCDTGKWNVGTVIETVHKYFLPVWFRTAFSLSSKTTLLMAVGCISLLKTTLLLSDGI